MSIIIENEILDNEIYYPFIIIIRNGSLLQLSQSELLTISDKVLKSNPEMTYKDYVFINEVYFTLQDKGFSFIPSKLLDSKDMIYLNLAKHYSSKL